MQTSQQVIAMPRHSTHMTIEWRNDRFAPLSTRIARWRAFYAARRAERVGVTQ